jgi:hypothetical protein
MPHRIAKTVPCPICGTPADVTCHLTGHPGTLTVNDVLLDRAGPCPHARDDGHGPVSDDDWIAAWLAVPQPRPPLIG